MDPPGRGIFRYYKQTFPVIKQSLPGEKRVLAVINSLVKQKSNQMVAVEQEMRNETTQLILCPITVIMQLQLFFYY